MGVPPMFRLRRGTGVPTVFRSSSTALTQLLPFTLHASSASQMEITTEKTPDLLVARLRGRLDSTWCPAVQDALTAYVKAGEHALRLDMSGVDYISSTGLRVLLSTYKQLKAVKGRFVIAPASAAVTETLSLAGMDILLAPAPTRGTGVPDRSGTGVPPVSDSDRRGMGVPPMSVSAPVTDTGLRGEVFTLPATGPALSLRVVSTAATDAPLSFPTATFGLGVGALGTTSADTAGRHGEFIAAGGCAAYQPTDGANRPDFLVTQGALVPQARLVSGLAGSGVFTHLLRFEALPDARVVTLSSLAASALQLTGSDAAAFVAVNETAGLVGASLRRDPTLAPTATDRLAFPQIRDWLSFTGERSFRDTTTLLVGVVARPGYSGPLASQLRPLSTAADAPLGHVHALVVPYRPLQKGLIDLTAMVSSLFDGPTPQALLHLLGDSRGISGAGESDFQRGAVWFAALPKA